MRKWDPSPEIVVSHMDATHSTLDEALVSVCIPAFNYEDYVLECLDSVYAQTHREIEVVVVDDASSDGTVDAVEQWLNAHRDRFRGALLLRNPRNQGPAATRNTAIGRARGDYVFLLDADNQIYPRAVHETHAVARSNGFDAVYTQLEFFGREVRLGEADIYDPTKLRRANYIDVMALIRKACWAQVGGFSHLELGWEDYDFWLKFQDAGFSFAYLPEILCRYRKHGTSRTDLDAHPSHQRLEQIMALRHPTFV